VRAARRVASLVVAVTVAALLAGPAASAGAREPRCRPYDPSRDPELASWATRRRATLLVDSVLLSALPGIKKAMPCWRIAKRGRPALMIRIAERELSAAGRRLSPLVVVGLGHNTLWERNRHNYDMWAARFDAESRKLVATLRRLGARQIVWVTLREPRPAIVPPGSGPELHRYAWYFPYVNARLHKLDAERDDLSLADWTTAANRPHITYDTMHCNTRGALLMGRTIKRAINAEARRQARAGRA
jgi:hypothetical protein